jgi:uncharacterized delta-60 repeat protein
MKVCNGKYPRRPREELDMVCRSATAVLVAAWLWAPPAFGASQGELDPSFGENGRLFVEHHSPYFSAFARQDDGKLVLASGSDVYRLNADGSWDDGFGEHGIARIEEFGDGYFGMGDLAVQPDGKVILAGQLQTDWFGGQYDPAMLVRINPDGSLDSGFGDEGRVLLHLGGWGEYISRVVVLEDGRIVVAGGDGGRVMFARFEPDGTLDASFGTGPVAGITLVHLDGDSTVVNWMVRQGDGKFVACGTNGPYGLNADTSILLVRVTADGAVDSTFGVDGVSLVAEGTVPHAMRCLSLPDSAIVLAGNSGYLNVDLVFARVTPEGMQDAGFGEGGITRIDLGGIEELTSMVRFSDGRLGVSGRTAAGRDYYYDPSLMFVARIDADSGLPDPGFGNEGVTMVDFGDGRFISRFRRGHLFEESDGKLVAVGFTEVFDARWDVWQSPAWVLARLDPSGAGHPGFAGFAGPTVLRAASTEGSFEAVAVVQRTGGSTGPLAVDFETIGHTAQAPGDFTATSGTLTWADGEADAKSISVPVTVDGAGTFDIQLSNSTGGLATSLVTVALPPPSSGGGGGSGGTSARGGGGGIAAMDLLALLLLGAVYWATQLAGAVRHAVDTRGVAPLGTTGKHARETVHARSTPGR